MKNPRLADVAARAKVNIMTASRALNGQPTVRANIRERVEKAAQELNYQPNQVARAMATRSSNLVTLGFHGLHNPLYAQIADRLLSRLRAAELHGVFLDRTDEVANFNASYFTAGSILFYPSLAHVKALARQRPVVIFGESYAATAVPCVSLDVTAAFTELTQAALSRGRRKMGFFLNPASPDYSTKIQPIEIALKAAGLKVLPQPSELYNPADPCASAARLAELIAQQPQLLDTIFCGWDMDAARVLTELQRQGIRAPEQIQVIGCDGTIPLPSTWTVKIDVKEIARKLVELLERQLQGEKTNERIVICPTASF